MTGVPLVPEPLSRRLVSPAAYAEWDGIHADLAFLRRELPLAVAHAEGYDPFWVVAKYEDVQAVSRKPEIFRTSGYRCVLSSQANFAYLDSPGAPPTIRALVTMDPPEHWAFRRLTFQDFAPKSLRGLEDAIRVLAVESIEEMLVTGGRCDFVADVALRYPLRVILSVLGLPRADEDMMLRLTQEFFNPQDPDLNVSGREVAECDAAAFDLDLLARYTGYFNDLTDRLRAEPQDTIASKIANGRVGDELISHWDAMSQYVAVATAGHDTTSSSTAGGVWALAERPAIFERVRADPALISKLVDESVRWTSPLLSFMRTAAIDCELRGQRISKGDWLMLSYPSANRDEDIFEEPFDFSLDRRENVHIGFGYGPHICLGQHLAKLEMRIFYEELFRRVTSLELDGEPTRTRSATVGSIKTLPLRFAYN